VIKTTPAQDAKIEEALRDIASKEPALQAESSILWDNCSVRSNRGLDAGGIPRPDTMDANGGAIMIAQLPGTPGSNVASKNSWSISATSMKLGIGQLKRVIMLATLLLAIILLWAGLVHQRKKTTCEKGYQQIRIGDSADVVIGFMGTPNKITDCKAPAFADEQTDAEYHKRCDAQYWYFILFKDYVISFDKEKNVIGKDSAVSP
jgi:hypothetical protein